MFRARWKEIRIPWGMLTAGGTLLVLVAYEGSRLRGAQAAQIPSNGSRGETKPRRPGIFADGRVVVTPGGEVTVAAETSARLVSLRVETNAVVKQGQMIAELDATEQKAAIAEARARLVESQEELRFSEVDVERSTALQASGVVTPASHDKLVHATNVARARLATFTAGIHRLQAALEKTKIRAPIGGTVVTQHANVGEVVGVGVPLVTIVDFSRLRVEVEVGEFDIAGLSDRSNAVIRAEGYPESWQGEVVEIPLSVVSRRLKPLDPGRPSDTRILPIKVSLPQGHPLKLGQRVEVEIAG